MKHPLFLVVLVATALSCSALGQMRPGRRPPPSSPVPPHLVMERLSRMTPEQRDDLLGKLPEERRSVLEQRLRKYSELPEPVKKRVRDEYEIFQQLPPEKQDELRKLFREMSEFPEERRPVIRKELIRLRDMKPERREKRMNSGKFKDEFSESERRFLTAVTDLLARPVSAN